MLTSLLQIRCGQCLRELIPVDQEKDVAGIEGVYCSKDDHFDHGEQAAWRIFGRDCEICFITSDEGGDMCRTQCGKLISSLQIYKYYADCVRPHVLLQMHHNVGRRRREDHLPLLQSAAFV